MGKALNKPGGISQQIVRAMSLFTGVQSVSILCSIVRAKLISLWIGTVGVGLFAVFNSVLDMMSTATQFNLRQSAVRDISASSTKRLPVIATAVRWWARNLGLLGALAIAALSPVLSIFSFGDMSYWWAFASLSLAMLARSLTNGEQAIMQGSGQLAVLARTSVGGALLGTAISVPLYYLYGQLSIIPTIIIYSVALLYFAWRNRVNTGHSDNTRAVNIQTGRGFMKLGIYLTISSVTTTVASYAFISFINNGYGSSATGIYQAGYTILINYTGIIFTALSMEFFPRVTKVVGRPSLTSVVVSHEMLVILYVLTPLLVLFVAADELILRILYSQSFLAALPFITVGILAMVFRAISYCMAYVLIAAGNGRVYVTIEIISAAVGLTLNIVCFKLWSYAGLGLSYVAWYAIYTVLVAIPYIRNGHTLNRASGMVSVAAVTIVACAILLKPIGWWCSLLMVFPAATLSYQGYKSLWQHHGRDKGMNM